MISYSLDITDPDNAYMLGFIQADGHLYQTTRDRGRLQIELQEADEYILTRFASMIPFHCSMTKRTRATNFMEAHKSVMLRVYDKSFRDALTTLGIPYGKKSGLVSVPACAFSRADYFRGLLDADGSIGITGKGFPFVSLVTASEQMARSFLEFVTDVTGKVKLPNRNRRDGVFNIIAYKEDAQALASVLYYEGCLALPRKKEAALIVLEWARPEYMRKVNFERKTWVPEEDSYILTHTIDASAQFLSRTPRSIKVRLWRLRGQ